jgi:2,5-furandicarboxylate decarboxylase 1
MTVFSTLAAVKLVVIVDEDVDVFSDEMVGWAVATRFQADRDLIVIPRSRGGGLDPSAEGGPTAKLVLDATVAPDKRKHHAQMRTRIADSDRVHELIGKLRPGYV